jgi:cobalt-zinc-cadmium efflux system membrane fusion protein
VHDGDKDYIFLKNGDRYDKKLVELGSIEGDSVEVLSGLNAGQMIVKHGALYLGSQESGD